jgi:AhpD family alkylhydroperoxidase
MPRVSLLPPDVGARMRGTAGPEARRALMHRPQLADAIGALNDAVMASELPPRLHELVRYRIAQLNGCSRCMAYRAPDSRATEELLAQVESWRDSTEMTEAERAALDFAERFSVSPSEVDDELVDVLREHLGDAGVVDLAVCVAKYVATGRLIAILDLDQACVVPGDPTTVALQTAGSGRVRRSGGPSWRIA